MDQQYPTLAKIPVLDTGKFEQWQFRIQQYLQLEHYALWEKKKNDVKARTTLLLSLPDEHQLRFSKYKTAKELWAAILKTFGASNEELKEPIEDQPLPVDASPTTLSPGYVVDSDPEKDEKDPKEDPADYPADRGDNDDDDESSNDDEDDDDVEKDEEDKEEEEHLTLADPFDVSTDDLFPLS
nr:hypothetical protein [Tanacetum cinerariifolium]